MKNYLETKGESFEEYVEAVFTQTQVYWRHPSLTSELIFEVIDRVYYISHIRNRITIINQNINSISLNWFDIPNPFKHYLLLTSRGHCKIGFKFYRIDKLFSGSQN